MVFVRDGCVLDKVNERSGRRQARFVAASGADLVLRWSKGSKRLGARPSQLDLSEVTRIEYGLSARSFVLYARTALPWLCFSLYNTRRSFDFICPDEQVAQCFLLVLSRLCRRAAGGMESRERYLRQRAWLKVRYQAALENQTVLQLLSKAATRSYARVSSAWDPAEVGEVEGRGGRQPTSTLARQQRSQFSPDGRQVTRH